VHERDEIKEPQEKLVCVGEQVDIVVRHGFPMPEELLIDRLERSKWARDFAYRDIAGLAEHLKACEVPEGNYIIHEGDEERYLCILLSGEATVVKKDVRGGKNELAVLKKGAAFGELSLFEGRRRSASVVAETDCIVLVLTFDHLKFMEIDKPRLACKVYFKLGTVLSERLRATSANLVDAKGGFEPHPSVF
jgi:CRP-like cAMP-binding protein